MLPLGRFRQKDKAMLRHKNPIAIGKMFTPGIMATSQQPTTPSYKAFGANKE